MRDSALNSSGRWWGFNADSVLPNYFSGDLDLAKPRLNFPARRRGLGRNAGGSPFRIFLASAMVIVDKIWYYRFDLNFAII